jgi:hypothetical protein
MSITRHAITHIPLNFLLKYQLDIKRHHGLIPALPLAEVLWSATQ